MTGGPQHRRSLFPWALVVVLWTIVTGRAELPEGETLEGDWEIQSSDAEARRRLSILALSGDADRTLTGLWITDAASSELEDVTCDDGKLSFRWDDQTFSGMIGEDILRGIVSHDRETRAVTGRRMLRLPEIVGNWAFSYSRAEVTLALAIRSGIDERLTLSWKTADGDVPITEFSYEAGRLTFTSEMGGYEGRLRGPDALDGTLTVNQRDFPVLASRMGTPVIGTWNLDVTSEDGETVRQRLKVNPDMSGWYGITPIEVRLKHDVPAGPERASRDLAFDAAGDSEKHRRISFVGEVTDASLTGEITTPTGRSTLVGRRLPLPSPSDESP